MAILVVLGVIGILFLGTILNGWVFSILWEWFVAPVFGLPLLSIPAAIGVALCSSYLTHQQSFHEDHKVDPLKTVAHSLLRPFMALAIGFIVKQFI